jgi:hypothetical protein
VSELEVQQPIICSPFDEPDKHWHLEEGTTPTEPTPGRRPAHYFYREPGHETEEGAPTGTQIELELVNFVRGRVKDWRRARLSGRNGDDARIAQLLAARRPRVPAVLRAARSRRNHRLSE